MGRRVYLFAGRKCYTNQMTLTITIVGCYRVFDWSDDSSDSNKLKEKLDKTVVLKYMFTIDEIKVNICYFVKNINDFNP